MIDRDASKDSAKEVISEAGVMLWPAVNPFSLNLFISFKKNRKLLPFQHQRLNNRQPKEGAKSP